MEQENKGFYNRTHQEINVLNKGSWFCFWLKNTSSWFEIPSLKRLSKVEVKFLMLPSPTDPK